MKLEDVTKEMLIAADIANVVWLRDDWLSMRGYETDPEKLAVYDRIADMKQEMVAEGYSFKCDREGI